jgi:NitT/TauT family transport system substrate-binding protein
MKKFITYIIIIALIAIIGILWWQFGGQKEEAPKTTGEVMRIAKNFWPGQYWIEIADAKGWFKEAGLNVELIDTNPDYYQSLQDSADGKIDINNFSLYDLISYHVKGADLVMIINADTSSGADAIVARQDINSVSDLQSMTIAVSTGFYTDYILQLVLDEYGLRREDVTIVEITDDQNDNEAPEEFAKGSFDAVLTWEPIVSQIVELGGKVIWDTSNTKGISPNGVVLKKEFIKRRPEDVLTYVNVWHKTTEFIKENPDEAFGIIANIYGVPVREVRDLANLDKILDLRDNKTSFSYGAGFDSLHGVARQMNDFMIESGITDRRLDTTTFIDPHFIRKVSLTP